MMAGVALILSPVDSNNDSSNNHVMAFIIPLCIFWRLQPVAAAGGGRRWRKNKVFSKNGNQHYTQYGSIFNLDGVAMAADDDIQ